MAQISDTVKYEEEFVVNSHGKKLFTCRWLPEEVEPKALIFICHGYASECSISMRGTATRLVHAGYAVYGIDHEGHGKSSGLKGYISNFGDLVNDCSNFFMSICEKQENRKKKRFLYGLSMGGTLALLVHRREPTYWDGAVLLAPMCKIADDMCPSPFVIGILKMIRQIAPKWKVIPTPDMIDKVCKNPETREEIRSNPYMYKGNLSLNTGYELLMVSQEIEKNLDKVSLPFMVLHGGDDIVTDPSGSKLLYDLAASSDKTFKLYPGMWHVLTAELPEDAELVHSDVISWLDERATASVSRHES